MPAGICRFGKSSKGDSVQRGMMGLSVSHELHCERLLTGTTTCLASALNQARMPWK